MYYISKRNNPLYEKQTLTDINKMFSNDKVIVFLEDFDRMNKRNKYFTISGKSIQIINPTDDNLELIEAIKDIDSYDIIREIYKGKKYWYINLKGNRSKINEMLVKSTNINEIDRCLDKVRNEIMLCK